MGLGGALISQHRRHAAADHAQRRRAARERALERARAGDAGQMINNNNYYRNTLRNIAGGERARATGRWSQDDYDAVLARILTAPNPPEILYFPPSDDARRPEYREPDYLPLYTHPVKHLPGFTPDFIPASDPPPANAGSSSEDIIIVEDSPVASTSSASSDEATSLIVCAQCLDPLTLNNGTEDAQSRLWGLRCGHIIDGKCMQKLMQPPQTVVDDQQILVPKLEQDQRATTATDDDHSVRSRLRSYRSGQHTPAQAPTPPTWRRRNLFARWWGADDEDDEDDPVDLIPRPNHHRGKRNKGKNKVVEPAVEATHEWTCPVSGCGKVHTSLLIEGKWTVDKERGAIGIYA